MSSIPINEPSSLLMTKSTKGDPTATTTTTTKNRKYTVLDAIMSVVGLAGYSVAHYTSSSGNLGHGCGPINSCINNCINGCINGRINSHTNGCINNGGGGGGGDISAPVYSCWIYIVFVRGLT